MSGQRGCLGDGRDEHVLFSITTYEAGIHILEVISQIGKWKNKEERNTLKSPDVTMRS